MQRRNIRRYGQRNHFVGNVKASKSANQSWKALFAFTAKTHLPALLPGLIISVVAGIVQPAVAIFFGKFFNTFSAYGAGSIDGTELMHETLVDVYALVGIGVATWFFKGGEFSTWVIFGEMQAKSVRDELFNSLLRKDIAWYDTRTTGVGALLSRLQT